MVVSMDQRFDYSDVLVEVFGFLEGWLVPGVVFQPSVETGFVVDQIEDAREIDQCF